MPDLNSVPESPHSLANSRRQSTDPHPAPASPSLNILPSNQNAVIQGQPPALPSPLLPVNQQPPPPSHSHSHSRSQSRTSDIGVGPGPGPIRHPRPLTAAELHLELEKEQEAVVNRLTRELSLLRAAQNASVVSNTSSTSAANSTHEHGGEASLLSGSGFSIPTSRRHHRTSSATSQGLAQLGSSYEGRSHHGRPPPQPLSLSRQDSTASRRSQTNSPGPQAVLDPLSYFQHHRIPHPPTSVPVSSVGATPGSVSGSEPFSPALMPATSRYEETAFYRNELDTAKKENEMLKRRIRELERQLRDGRASEAASRPRSDSTSTAASLSITPGGGTSIAGPRESGVPSHQRPERERGLTSQSVLSVAGSVGVGVPEDEVKVGESAASGGGNNSKEEK